MAGYVRDNRIFKVMLAAVYQQKEVYNQLKDLTITHNFELPILKTNLKKNIDLLQKIWKYLAKSSLEIDTIFNLVDP